VGRGRFEQVQRAGDVGVHERLARVRGHVRLVQRGRVQHVGDAAHAVVDHGAIDDRTHPVRERGRQQVDADDVPALLAQRAHQRLAEMTGAAGDEDLHDLEFADVDGKVGRFMGSFRAVRLAAHEDHSPAVGGPGRDTERPRAAMELRQHARAAGRQRTLDE
jgi:hypothetical protein